MKLTAYEKERLIYINRTMNELHTRLNAIYENLVDGDTDDLALEIIGMIEELKMLLESTNE